MRSATFGEGDARGAKVGVDVVPHPATTRNARAGSQWSGLNKTGTCKLPMLYIKFQERF